MAVRMADQDSSTSFPPIHLDGTTLEGGGQLLRLALSLSSLTYIPIHVTDIRGKRGPKSSPGKDGGLKPAHLAGVKWLASATAAQTEGMEVKSRGLTFRPTRPNPMVSSSDNLSQGAVGTTTDDHRGVWKDKHENGKLIGWTSEIPVSTPGSLLLVLQAILPYLLFGHSPSMGGQKPPIPLHVTIEGGTNVSNSPSIEYVSQVLLPMLSRRLGISPITTTLHKRGWSTGRNEIGSVTFNVTPIHGKHSLPPFTFQDRGQLSNVHVSILAPDATARGKIRDIVVAQLLAYNPEVEIFFPVDENSGSDKRFYMLLVAETSGGYRLGRDWLYDLKTKGSKNDEIYKKLVSKVVRDLKRELKHDGCVDEYMQDQLVVFQALAAGKAAVVEGKDQEASLHTKTARWVVEEMLGVAFDDKGSCEGLGFCAGERFRERFERHGKVEDSAKGRAETKT